jgi:hypothetical protein
MSIIIWILIILVVIGLAILVAKKGIGCNCLKKKGGSGPATPGSSNPSE